ncbi:hypothetical protein [Flavobacterium sp. GCM10027622]|uniref:hypothetical protein n=1 Tax=unclassified Flavobacterium TaxID=196869 RepID=UPI0036091AAB
MTDEFKPPINERSTNQLLDIVCEPKKWNERAVMLAQNELANRNVSRETIQQKTKQKIYIANKEIKVENLRKAKEKYDLLDFIFSLDDVLIEVLFTWDLKKQGYTKKAKQQKTILCVLAIVISILIIVANSL